MSNNKRSVSVKDLFLKKGAFGCGWMKNVDFVLNKEYKFDNFKYHTSNYGKNIVSIVLLLYTGVLFIIKFIVRMAEWSKAADLMFGSLWEREFESHF